MFIGVEALIHTYMPNTPFSTTALTDISFGLEKGEVALIIGPSGSGKTTLVQHLNGLLKPAGGRVFFEGKTINYNRIELLRLRRRVGLVFQAPEDHFFCETIYDEVAFAPRNLGLPEDEVSLRVQGSMEKVGLDAPALLDIHPHQLSTGHRRLVAMAAVFALEPEVLVLDEPAAGLDHHNRQKVFNMLARIVRDENLTLFIATHHLDETVAFADRVLVLQGGKMAMTGGTAEVFARKNELISLGLELPPVTAIMFDLAEKGVPVKTAVFTLEEARREINKCRRGLPLEP